MCRAGRSPFGRWLVGGLAALLTCGLPAGAAPAHPHELALAPLLAEARAHHPGVLAAKARWEAAAAHVAGQGLLPDPMVQASLMNIPRLAGPQAAVSQTFPTGGKLGLARDVASRQAEVARRAYLEALNDALGEIKQTYYEVYALQRADAIVTETRAVAATTSRMATARYGAGQGQQGEPLRANEQVTRMLHEGLAVHRQLAAAGARLWGLVGRDPAAVGEAVGLAVAEAPRGAVPALAAVVTEADAHNPAIARARAEVDEAAAERAMAAASESPDVNAQLGVGRVFMDMGWETAVTGMVGITVPYGNGQKRQAAAVAEADRQLVSRRLAVQDQVRAVHQRLAEVVATLPHLRDQLQLLDHGLRPLARQSFAAALASYQVGKADFTSLLDAQAEVYRIERERTDALADYHKLRSELETLTGREVAGMEPDR